MRSTWDRNSSQTSGAATGAATIISAGFFWRKAFAAVSIVAPVARPSSIRITVLPRTSGAGGGLPGRRQDRPPHGADDTKREATNWPFAIAGGTNKKLWEAHRNRELPTLCKFVPAVLLFRGCAGSRRGGRSVRSRAGGRILLQMLFVLLDDRGALRAGIRRGVAGCLGAEGQSGSQSGS